MQRSRLRSESADAGLDRLLATTCDGLVLASNRQPYRHTRGDDGIEVDRPAGGLTAGLDAVMRRIDGAWIAWGDGDADEAVVDEDGRVSVPPDNDDEAYTLERLWLDEGEVENYYYRISNRLLWPICHAALGNVDSCGDAWADYRSVNERFAAAVADSDDSDLVWLQDYHLSLAPRMIRERSSTGPFVAHSWHIPWPSWDTFRAAPHASEIVRGLLGADLLGFHVPRYCENFLRTADRAIDDAEVDAETGRIKYDGHATTVRAFPMGVPVEEIRDQADSAKAAGFWESFRRNRGLDADTRLAVGVDRLDYTKGVVQRLDAIERFLADSPDWQGEFTYVQVGTESRSEIPAYRRYQESVEAAVERVNDRFATDDWQPVIYTTEMLPDEALASLYRHADLGVVSSVRDGMNLVAQEYVAAQLDGDGALLLSDQTGAHDEYGEHAVSIRPHDTDGFADAIERALTMPDDERARRMAALSEAVEDNDIDSWIRDVFGAVNAIRGDATESADAGD